MAKQKADEAEGKLKDEIEREKTANAEAERQAKLETEADARAMDAQQKRIQAVERTN